MRCNRIHFGPERPRQRWLAGKASGGGSTRPQKLRVLIVEDELFVAMHLESVLEEIGYEISAVLPTGESALDEFARLQPDIVLMDINLGRGIDGITAAQRIRATSDVQIIFVSAYSDAATRNRVETTVPGSPLLSKPVSPDSLRNAVERRSRH